MRNANDNGERRDFLKKALGVGTALWLTPSILSMTASKGYAQLSGGGGQPGHGPNGPPGGVPPGLSGTVPPGPPGGSNHRRRR